MSTGGTPFASGEDVLQVSIVVAPRGTFDLPTKLQGELWLEVFIYSPHLEAVSSFSGICRKPLLVWELDLNKLNNKRSNFLLKMKEQV